MTFAHTDTLLQTLPPPRTSVDTPDIRSPRVSSARSIVSAEDSVSEAGAADLRSTPPSVRYATKASVKSGAESTKSKTKDILHTAIELRAINSAIDHLLTSEDRVVLVDILERDPKKGFSVTVPLASHTVVLYKNPLVAEKYTIVVIDPNNLSFSNHLASTNKDIGDNVLRCHSATLEEIQALPNQPKPVQIYQAPKGSMGLEPDQYRDCIDIAVKLAFGFANTETHEVIDLNQLKENLIVKAISNQEAIDESFKGEGYSVRAKQTSNPEAVLSFYNIQRKIDKKLAYFASIKEDDIDYQEYIELLEQKAAYPAIALPLILAYSEKLSQTIASLTMEVDRLDRAKVTEIIPEAESIIVDFSTVRGGPEPLGATEIVIAGDTIDVIE